MRWILTFLGVLLSAFFLAISALMNWRFGFTLGATEFDAYIYASLSATADGLKALIPFFGYVAWRQKMRLPAFACILVWLVCTAYSFTSGFGFSASNRANTTSDRQAQITAKTDLRDDRNLLLAKLKALPKHRPAKAVYEKIKAQEQQNRWRSSNGCTDATANKSISFCNQYRALTSEHAVAIEAGETERKLATVKTRLRKFSENPVGRIADPQTSELARLLGFEKSSINTALVLLVATLAELGSGLGFFITFAYFRASTIEHNDEIIVKMSKEKSVVAELTPEPKLIEHTPSTKPHKIIEAYINDRIEPAPDEGIFGKELYTDFCAWCELRGAPPMSMRIFGEEAKQQIDKGKISGRVLYKNVRFIGASLALLQQSENARIIDQKA